MPKKIIFKDDQEKLKYYESQHQKQNKKSCKYYQKVKKLTKLEEKNIVSNTSTPHMGGD